MSSLVSPLRSLQQQAYSSSNLTYQDRLIFIRAYEAGCSVQIDPDNLWLFFVQNCLMLLQMRANRTANEEQVYICLETMATQVGDFDFLREVQSYLTYLRGEPVDFSSIAPAPLTRQIAAPVYLTGAVPYHEAQ